MKTVLWVGGWGISESFALREIQGYFSNLRHRIICPSHEAMNEVKKGDFDVLVGYSLGAHLIATGQLSLTPEVLLIAPFGDITLAGALRRGHLQKLKRQVVEDPLCAVNDFYKRAGLPIAPVTQLPYAQEDLIWGIERMMSPQGEHVDFQGQSFFGGNDPIICGGSDRDLFPNAQILSSATHHLTDYFQYLPL